MREPVLRFSASSGHPRIEPLARAREAFSRRIVLALAPLVCGCAASPKPPTSVEAPAPPRAPSPPLRFFVRDSEYRIGPGDLLTVRVGDLERVGEVSTLDLEVSPDGRISLPLLDAVEAEGNTTAELRGAIASALGARFLRSPFVSVAVREYRSRRILVVGAVARPGAYTLTRGRSTLLDALALAGGVTEKADPRLEILHGEVSPDERKDGEGATSPPARVEVDLEALLDRGELSEDVPIRSGDVIRVPEAGQYSVSGFVAKPGVFALRRKTTVLQGVTAAGGYAGRRASPAAAFVRRRDPDGTVERVPVDLTAIAQGQAEDILLRPGDHLEVPQTGMKSFWTEAWDFLRGRVGVVWPGTL